MNSSTMNEDKCLLLAHRLRKIASELAALGDRLLRPPDADHGIGPNAVDQRVLGLFLTAGGSEVDDGR